MKQHCDSIYKKILSFRFLIIISLIFGGLFSLIIIHRTDCDMRQSLLLQTQTVAKAVNVKQIMALSGSPSDLTLPQYKSLKEQFTAIKSANSKIRFVYLLGRKNDGAEYNILDSEPPESEAYSLPGHVYDEPQDVDIRVFASGKPETEGPISDSYGTYITALVPINHPKNGRIIALFGIDMDASGWNDEIISKATLPITFMLVFIFAIIIFLILMNKDYEEKDKNQKRIEFLSFHDQLTGLYNRRFYEENLITLNTKENLPLSVVMADVNGLKLANDAFGHALGDKLLKKAAQSIKNECRSNDTVARIGGDEFIILLPKTNFKQTEQVVRRIKEAASTEKVDSIDLSISFGWATKIALDEDIDEIFKKAEDYMYKVKLFESQSIRKKTIKTIISSIYEKFPGEKEHSQRVSIICEAIGEKLGFIREDIDIIKTAGLLHDIGKITLDEKTLYKPDKWNDIEWNEIKRHPETGYRILSSVNDMTKPAEYVLAHHERWNGSGYPKGLKGKDIPLQSRIIAIADTYDAMINGRPYRKILSKEQALKEIVNDSGILFDPRVVKVFEKLLIENDYKI